MRQVKDIVLGSGSPRRQELLEKMGLEFKVVSSDVDEVFPKEMPCSEVALFLARLKGNDLKENIAKDTLLITADTVVVLNDEIIGKPGSKDVAKEMLRSLSGNTHTVYTAYAIFLDGQEIKGTTDQTTVTFLELSDSEINYYVEAYSPLDRAGSYGIQDWIGIAKIKGMQGNFYNVMGLPCHLLYQDLVEAKAIELI